MKNIDAARRPGIRFRAGVLCAALGVGLGVVLNGAWDIQVKDGEAWRTLAEKQRMRQLRVTPKRGTIYDRAGTALAISVDVPSVSMDAVEMLRGVEQKYLAGRIDGYAARIAEALHLEVAEVAEKLRRGKRFTWLKRRVTSDEVKAVRELGDRNQRYPILGLSVEGEGRRFYPHRELAASLLGFVSPDGQGREGVELALDEQLRGRAEEIRGLRDRAGRLIFSEGIQDEAALAGHDIHLTIDQSIQFLAERELDAALKTHEAKAGSILVVDPQTGEMLALASAPGFNPNDYNLADPASIRNHAIGDVFEPGSTMKMFSMAAALSANSVKPDEPVYCEEGHMPIDNVVIHDTHVSKWLTPTQILQYSSNIGIAKIGLGLGEEKLYQSFRRFGFGENPGLPVSGSSVGILRPRARPWVPVETASAAFGQGVSVTNLQLTMAMAALANRGRLLEPILVSKVTDSTGVVLSEATPKVRRQVVSPRIARMMADMLSSVTEGEGTGVEAAIPGFRVAGKTATAQKVDPTTGRYNDVTYVTSFIGFVPAERPRLVVSVVIDEPTAGANSGGSVAAPVFRRVAEQSLHYLGVRPDGTRAVKLTDVAEYAKVDDPAKSAYAALDERPDSGGEEAPADGPGVPVRDGVKVPLIEGLPMRSAIQTLLEKGFVPVIQGTGRLVRTEPAVGTKAPRGAKVVLVFEPPT
ncbi:MAG: PASTA domain-containing protein [Deltaproteobacteria bacterium]|nr:PASTA domain-containing protein [Deltaproteobacteria bacterium]